MERLESGGAWVVLCLGGLPAVGVGGGRQVSEVGLAGPGWAGRALEMAGGRTEHPGTESAQLTSGPTTMA